MSYSKTHTSRSRENADTTHVLDLRGLRYIPLERCRNRTPITDIQPPQKRYVSKAYQPEHARSLRADASARHMHAFAAPLVRVTAAFLIVALNVIGLAHTGTTVSYYADTEMTDGNRFASGLLSITVDEPNTTVGLACGDERTVTVDVAPESGSVPSQYRVDATQESGEACTAFSLLVTHGGVEVFRGLMSDFTGVTATRFAPWEFEIALPQDKTDLPKGASCEIALTFAAWQEEVPLFSESGFTDEERMRIEAVKSTSASIGTTTVENTNDATVTSTTTAEANTGGNTAGEGGTVITGDATSTASSENRMNVNRTNVGGAATSSDERTERRGSDRTSTITPSDDSVEDKEDEEAASATEPNADDDTATSTHNTTEEAAGSEADGEDEDTAETSDETDSATTTTETAHNTALSSGSSTERNRTTITDPDTSRTPSSSQGNTQSTTTEHTALRDERE